LARTLHVEFALIDPDTVSPKNLGRQLFISADGHKVDVYAEAVRSLTGYSCDSFAVIASESNIDDLVGDGDVVFVCPDNHACRRVVAERARHLQNVVVFTAGNEAFTGNVHAYIRQGNREVTKHLKDCHPDVYTGEQNPLTIGMSCSNLMDHGNYQILTTNFATASLAIQMFFLVNNCHSPLGLGKTTSRWPQDGWIDVLTGNQRIDLVDNEFYRAPRIVDTLAGVAR
jgi:hypothetical protein